MTYAPFGRCIYCGSVDSLSDEHIIPAALNGVLILPKASCSKCADITKRFEQAVARSNYGPLRIKLGFKTRRKKERPTHLPLRYRDADGSTQEAHVPVADFPTVYVAAAFPPPGIFTGAPPSTRNPEFNLGLKGNREEIERAFTILKQESVELSNNFSWGAFCKQIAKIGHAFVVASIGTEGYEPLLPDIILGRSEFLSHLVGGVPDSARPEQDLALVIVTHQEEHYLVAYVQLFGVGRLPAYQAVAGRITDLNRVLTNVALLNKAA